MMPMLEDVPSEICGRNFRMDPIADDIVRGRELQENMVILVESRDNRLTSPEEGSIAGGPRLATILDVDRWCIVTKLSKRGNVISFVGVYCDGHKAYRVFDPDAAWYVKYWSAPELLDEKNLRNEEPMPQWERDLLAGPMVPEAVREPAEGWT